MLLYGMGPLQIFTHKGTNFDGNLIRKLRKLLGTDRVRSSSYHPSENGMNERFHKTLIVMLGNLYADIK